MKGLAARVAAQERAAAGLPPLPVRVCAGCHDGATHARERLPVDRVSDNVQLLPKLPTASVGFVAPDWDGDILDVVDQIVDGRPWPERVAFALGTASVSLARIAGYVLAFAAFIVIGTLLAPFLGLAVILDAMRGEP